MLSRSGVIYIYKEPSLNEATGVMPIQPQKADLPSQRIEIVPAVKKVPELPSVHPLKPVLPVQRTLNRFPPLPPVKRPFSPRKPTFFGPPAVKTIPQRPAFPFDGHVTVEIETKENVPVKDVKAEPVVSVQPKPEPQEIIPVVPKTLPIRETPVGIQPEIQPRNIQTVSDAQPKATSFSLPRVNFNVRRVIGAIMLTVAIGGVTLPILPQARLETSYATQQLERKVDMMVKPTVSLPPSVPLTFTPLIGPDGKEIVPINKDFSIIVPKIGINANIVASVDPLNSKEYTPALQKGVAHAKTSYFPDQDGAVYLFSHSTNYEWFVKDLNAIFYNLKNLDDGDYIVIFYKGKRYTYVYKSREVVAPKDTSYLLPVTGKRQLILQTC